MVECNSSNDEIFIKIPVSGLEELSEYQRALLSLLSKISLDDCDEITKGRVKTVYRLLGHMLPDKETAQLLKKDNQESV